MHVMGAIIRRLLSQLPGVDSNPPFPHENCDSSLLLKHTRRCPSEVKFDGYPVAFNGRDLRPQPLAKRQARLHAPSVVVHSAFDTVRASWYGGLE